MQCAERNDNRDVSTFDKCHVTNVRSLLDNLVDYLRYLKWIEDKKKQQNKHQAKQKKSRQWNNKIR